jgi:type IV secretion system protein VirB11
MIAQGTARSEARLRLEEKLRRELGAQILSWLGDDEIIEIMLNSDGSLWVERLGHRPERLGEMAPHQAEALMMTLASRQGRVLDHRDPVIECQLPIDGSRFSGSIEPVHAPSFNIRRRALRIFALSDYVANAVMTREQQRLLSNAIRTRRNILVVGSTGSGKTTLANALIAEIAAVHPWHRLVIIEDTPEIQCAAPNCLIMQTSEHFDTRRALTVAMRRRPDRIIVGEVRGGEARTLIEAWNTGHAGGVATVHANDARSGLLRLEMLCAIGGAPAMQQAIAQAVNLLVFIAPTPAGRRLTEILAVDGYADGLYRVSQVEAEHA